MSKLEKLEKAIKIINEVANKLYEAKEIMDNHTDLLTTTDKEMDTELYDNIDNNYDLAENFIKEIEKRIEELKNEK